MKIAPGICDPSNSRHISIEIGSDFSIGRPFDEACTWHFRHAVLLTYRVSGISGCHIDLRGRYWWWGRPHGEYRRSYSHRLPSDSDRLICRSSKPSPRVTTCIMLSAITSGERVLIATGLRTLLACPLGVVCRGQAHVRSSKPDIRMPVLTSPRVMLQAVAFRHCYPIAVNSFTVNGLDYVADPWVVHSKEYLKPP
jgi:hypothetical protein